MESERKPNLSGQFSNKKGIITPETERTEKTEIKDGMPGNIGFENSPKRNRGKVEVLNDGEKPLEGENKFKDLKN